RARAKPRSISATSRWTSAKRAVDSQRRLTASMLTRTLDHAAGLQSGGFFLADKSTKVSRSGDRAPFLTAGTSFVRRSFGLLPHVVFFRGRPPASASTFAPGRQHRKPVRSAYLEQSERAGIFTQRPRARASPGAIRERRSASVTVAVASATTTITPAATAIAAATAGTRLARPRFVHGQPPPVVILIVKTANRLLRLGIGVHLDKTEALAASRVTVGDDLSTLDRSELREELLKIRTADLVGQVPDVQFLTHHQSPERNQQRPTVAFPGREERDRVKTQRAESGRATEEAREDSRKDRHRELDSFPTKDELYDTAERPIDRFSFFHKICKF